MPTALIDILILIFAGIVGGVAVGLAMKEYSLGIVKSIAAGAIGGGAGYFLQTLVPATVDITGAPVLDGSPVNHMATLALVGLGAGALLTLVLGFAKGEWAKNR